MHGMRESEWKQLINEDNRGRGPLNDNMKHMMNYIEKTNRTEMRCIRRLKYGTLA